MGNNIPNLLDFNYGLCTYLFMLFTYYRYHMPSKKIILWILAVFIFFFCHLRLMLYEVI